MLALRSCHALDLSGNETRGHRPRVPGKSHISCVLSPSLPYSVVVRYNVPPTRIVTQFDIKRQRKPGAKEAGPVPVRRVRPKLADSFDLCAQGTKALVDALVATVDELNVVDLAPAGRDQAGHDERDAGAYVGADKLPPA